MGMGKNTHEKPKKVQQPAAKDKSGLRRSSRSNRGIPYSGDLSKAKTGATEQELYKEDKYLIYMSKEGPEGRPTVPKNTWRNVYIKKTIGKGQPCWKDITTEEQRKSLVSHSDLEGYKSKFTKPEKYTEATKKAADLSWVAHTVNCCEPNCIRSSRVIFLTANNYKALLAISTPKGDPRCPPVCHDIPWASLKYYFDNTVQPKLMYQKREHTTAFMRAYCWYLPNLRPGHNGCNSAGAKVKKNTVTPDDLDKAADIYNAVFNKFISDKMSPFTDKSFESPFQSIGVDAMVEDEDEDEV
jgi:hypothetical protein